MANLAPLRAAVLIGGASSRMGVPKQMLEWAGETFLGRIIAALQGHGLPITLVGAGAAPAPFSELPRLPDAPGLAGPAAGVLAALRADGGSAWLIAACDLPRVTPQAVAWLLQQRRPEHVAILPRRQPEYVEPLLAIYEPGCAAVLEMTLGRPAARLQDIGRLPRVATPEVPAELRPAWCSVNTPAELADLRAETPPAPQRASSKKM